jgi:hypothetical protein
MSSTRSILGPFSSTFLISDEYQHSSFSCPVLPNSEDTDKQVSSEDVVGAGGRNIGIWRSIDNGNSWQAVDAPLIFSRGDGQQRTSIAAFAHSSEQPEMIYAATREVGLLRSDDKGGNWTRIAPSLPSKLENVAVSSDGRRMAVLGEEGGLFLSDDGANEWIRLDDPDRCPNPDENLPAGFVGESLLFTGDSLFAGTKSTLRSMPAYAGIYLSRDGGLCWSRIHDGVGIYGYKTLVEVPGEADSLLVLIFDSSQRVTSLTRLGVASGSTQPIWTSKAPIKSAILFDDSEPVHWYLATAAGEAVRGVSTQTTEGVYKWPRLWRCLLPCLAHSLALDGKGVPLLLARSKLYRVTEVTFAQWFLQR